MQMLDSQKPIVISLSYYAIAPARNNGLRNLIVFSRQLSRYFAIGHAGFGKGL